MLLACCHPHPEGLRPLFFMEGDSPKAEATRGSPSPGWGRLEDGVPQGDLAPPLPIKKSHLTDVSQGASLKDEALKMLLAQKPLELTSSPG